MSEERKRSYCSDCNKWLYADNGDNCCPAHFKEDDYHFMDTPKSAKEIHDLDYLEITMEDDKE